MNKNNTTSKKMLQEGDVIEIKKGHKVYAEIPQHFAYSNKKGCWDLVKKRCFSAR